MNQPETPPPESTPPEEKLFEVLPPEPTFIKAQTKPLKPAHTLANLWTIYVSLRGDIRHNTLEEYQTIARRFCAFFSTHPLDPEGMTQWIQYLQTIRHQKRLLNPRHINQMSVRIRSFLRWMYKMHYTREDLADCLPRLNAQARPPSLVFTETEYEMIKRYCHGREEFQPHLWLIILGYRTGMSLVDCCHLRWCHVHMHENGHSYFDIYRIKTQRLGEKARCQIPIIPGSDIHHWLLRLKSVPGYKRHDGITDYVHPDTDGLYNATCPPINRDFRHIFRRAGLPPLVRTFKHLRNSLVSNLVNSGVPLPLVCKITGHQGISTLLQYLKPDMNALVDGMLKCQQYSSLTPDQYSSLDTFTPSTEPLITTYAAEDEDSQLPPPPPPLLKPIEPTYVEAPWIDDSDSRSSTDNYLA